MSNLNLPDLIAIANAPIGIALGLTLILLLWPSLSMAKAAVLAALLVMACDPGALPTLAAETAEHLFAVIIIMSATSLPVVYLMDDGLAEDAASLLVRVCAHPWLRRVPSYFVLPGLMLPATMVAAMALHNIPSVLLLTPLAITLSRRLGVACLPLLAGMLIASNLGGASFAAGDTPAILQRMAFAFDVATFSANMLPRNLLILASLIGAVGCCGWYTARQRGTPGWDELYERLGVRAQFTLQSAFVGGGKGRPWALAALVVLLGSQFVSTEATLVVSLLILATSLAVARDFVRAAYVLGSEAWLCISSLFILATAVRQTPLVQSMAGDLLSRQGGIEVTAYLVTAMISADGAAGMLTALVHHAVQGDYRGAWALAAGICAGSSMLLSSASAGPVLIEAARREGVDLTFRAYARFGVPFSLWMMSLYIAMNAMAGG